MFRALKDLTARYYMEGANIDKLSLDLLISPSLVDILNKLSKNLNGLSIDELRSERTRTLSEDLKEVSSNNIIRQVDDRYMMTDLGKEVYRKIRKIVRRAFEEIPDYY
jgi:predicted transcriptional regulator